MQTICVDTSIIIDFARTKKGWFQQLLKGNRDHLYRLCTSTVVLFEYWSGKSMEVRAEQEHAELLFTRIELLPVDIRIAKRAGELKRTMHISSTDALITATALESNAQLATLNTKHFKDILGLQLWVPSLS